MVEPAEHDNGLQGPVDMFAIANLYDIDDELLVLHGIDNAIGALPNSIAFGSGQFSAPGRTRVVCQGLDACNDSAAIGFTRYRLQFFCG